MRKLLIVVILLLASIANVAAQNDARDERADVPGLEKGDKLVYVVNIKEQIAPPVWRMMQKSFNDAQKKNADLILLHMNTYGGMVETADSMRTKILNSKIPVIVYIDNNAASAGALISIACDSIYMRQGANIGASTVVNQNQEAAPDKYQSFMRSTMRSTAEASGRDPDIAEAMVDPDVYIAGVSDSGKVLTMTATEAMKNGYCEGIYNNKHEVVQAYGFQHYAFDQYRATAVDKIIGFLINPVVSGLLIMIIIGGIYFELQSPGIGFALIASLVAAVLYFAPLYLEGLAENWEILLFIGGLALLAVEIFAIPGFGVAGISGITLLVAGLTLSLVDNIAFDFSNVQMDGLVKAFFMVIVASFLALLGSYFLGVRMFAAESRIFGNLALKDALTAETGYTSANAVMKELVGRKGVAYTVLRPSGKIEIDDDIFDATAESGYIEKGEEVEVVSYHNTQLIVSRPFEDE